MIIDASSLSRLPINAKLPLTSQYRQNALVVSWPYRRLLVQVILITDWSGAAQVSEMPAPLILP